MSLRSCFNAAGMLPYRPLNANVELTRSFGDVLEPR